MVKKLRHIITALMLAVILVPMMAPASLLVHQWWVKWEMKEKLEHDDLQWVTVPRDEMKWYINGKECIIAGKMFDVKQVRELPGAIELLGIFDEKETEIEKKLSNTHLPDETERSMVIYHLLHLAAVDGACRVMINGPDLPGVPMLSKHSPCTGQNHRHISTPPPEA